MKSDEEILERGYRFLKLFSYYANDFVHQFPTDIIRPMDVA